VLKIEDVAVIISKEWILFVLFCINFVLSRLKTGLFLGVKSGLSDGQSDRQLLIIIFPLWNYVDVSILVNETVHRNV
jgi:hypothetical protein